MTADSNLEPKRNLLKRYPLISFFVLSYLFFMITIMIIGAVVTLTSVSDIIMGLLIAIASWTPNLAAVVITGVTGSKTEIRNLFASWWKWQVNPGWYLFGFAPILLAFVSAWAYSAFGGADLPRITNELTTSAFVLMAFSTPFKELLEKKLAGGGLHCPACRNVSTHWYPRLSLV